MQRAVEISRAVAVKALDAHAVNERAVHTLVEMRGTQREQCHAQRECERDDEDGEPTLAG